MSKTRKKFRFYTFLIVPSAEREEPFLNEMSQKGWHLVKANYCRYTFQLREPMDYQYRMDFISKELGREGYIQLLQDAGWEIVDTRKDELGLWAYCKKLRSEDGSLELYTDAESKLESVRRLKKAYWRVSGVVLVAFVPLALLLFDWHISLSGLIGGVFGASIGGIAIRRKMKRIQNDIV